MKNIHAQLYDVTTSQHSLNKELQQPQDSVNKVSYLTEINEQMFRQNVRLREYIEGCIQTKTVPTQEKYYQVLQED
ncbi:hypothetical protein QGM71_16085 [Virgibacillus sp. C22-A2]|uniref:Uncharacterized protein n=1 Tax=Virgibacillus tibetensis TaxID=3042313 RepID=A0ABU6KI62_9BACI|nr:hypothetical protein [Virgibacillus sp. C22-A2]